MSSEEEIDFYQEIYESCCELIDPHLYPKSHGGTCISRHSLTASVIESLDYLIQFWVSNRDKTGIDFCGVNGEE